MEPVIIIILIYQHEYKTLEQKMNKSEIKSHPNIGTYRCFPTHSYRLLLFW